MAFFKKEHRKESIKHTSVAEHVSEGSLSFPAKPVQKMSEGDAEVQMKSVTQKMAEEEETLQGRFDPVQKMGGDEEESLQGKFNPIQRRDSKGGLPGNLLSGIENLSGISLSDVKVHYNSSQPAQLNALAYAQGTDIHIAPGQEKHLPHEAWHTVQQKQGRVKPTVQMQKGVPVNDDKTLEEEADVMGSKALQMKSPEPVQLIKEWNKDGDQTLTAYAQEIKAEAITVKDTVDASRTNKEYITSLIQGITDAIKSGVMLQQVCNELYKAIKNKRYKPAEEEEPRYSLSSLESSGSLSDEQRSAIEERIAARNDGEARFNLHFGVGGVPTMDAGSTFGGKGRGDARLQFFKNGSMKIVDHQNRSWF